MTARQVPFKRILVDVDATRARHPALDQAADLAERCSAALKIVDVLPPVPPPARPYLRGALEEELVAHRLECLERLADGVAGRVPGVTTAVLRGSPAIAVIQDVLRHGHDLVMRAHGRTEGGGFPPFGTIDLQLLRKCPAPVWLVGPDAARRPKNLLVAVHALPEDRAETDLNIRLIELALELTDVEEGRLTLLYAWTAWGEDLLARRLSPEEFSEVVNDAHRTAHEALQTLAGAFGPRLANASIELPKGHPEEVIPEVVASRGIDLTVMGTVARRGVAGWIMGNTAERVLRHLRCSVLALKPPEFVCPVDLPADARATSSHPGPPPP